ncbi:hypothetical protein OPV22_028129 [Ensete ventricosum]|uniref:Uncharacterized protein n=1 Tax=Ensete ventricosum TaxID=4639 RepID=A0AAV8PXL8_ENSVE|nr:hypothetical protein OPV22_028129 [Ensete ventricosum]
MAAPETQSADLGCPPLYHTRATEEEPASVGFDAPLDSLPAEDDKVWTSDIDELLGEFPVSASAMGISMDRATPFSSNPLPHIHLLLVLSG